MTHRMRIGCALLLGAVAAGCEQATDGAAKVPSDEIGTATSQREQALQAAQEAAHSVREYAYAERDEFIGAADRELSEIQEEMARLRERIERSSGAARADAEAKLEVVSAKWTAAKGQLDQARAATEASWEDVQNRYRAARSDLESAFHDARQWLSDRIEP